MSATVVLLAGIAPYPASLHGSALPLTSSYCIRGLVVSKQGERPPEWVIRGKTIRQLIEELQTFEDQDLEVRMSVDDGETFRCISLVTREEKLGGHFCGLVNSESAT